MSIIYPTRRSGGHLRLGAYGLILIAVPMKPIHLAILALAIPAAAAPIRVMLLDGQSGGPYHDWRATTPVMKQELESTGLFQVDVVTAPASGGDFSQFKPDFKKYQVVVSNLDSPEWPSPAR